MPANRPTAKTGIPVKSEDCFSNRHLSGPEYKVYDVMMAFAVAGRVSREGKDGTGPLLFSASFKPTLVNALAQSVNQTMRMKDRLVELGWLVLVKKGERRATGQQAPDTYRIFTHEEYVAANPGSCPPYEYPPDYDTAQAYGVRHGQRLRDPGPLHKNFWPTEPVLRSALDKVTSEEPGIITDDELVALNKHLDDIKRASKPQNGVRTPNPGDGPEPQNGEGRTPNMVKAVPTKWEAPSPQNGEGRTQNPGENLVNPSRSFIPETQHTHTTPATPQGVGVCVKENLSAMDADIEVGKLLEEFVKQNEGEPGKCTSSQREKLRNLAMQHRRNKFRGAARVWLKEHPWDSRTTDPFSAFISGFEGYAGKIVWDKKRAEQKKRDEENAPAATEFHRRKAIVGYGLASVYKESEWYKSLTPEDLDYVAKVAAAKGLDDMPPDNGRDYCTEEIEFRKRQSEEAAADLRKLIEDGDF